jgi:hypothetical protein
VVVNRQNFLPVDSDIGARFFSQEKPEPIDLLILTHKVHTLDPERRTLSEMSGDLHNREILLIDPYLSFKEVGFLALRNGVNNSAVSVSDPIVPNYFKSVVFRSDQAVWVLIGSYPILFILHKALEHMVAYESRAFFGPDCEHLCSWSAIFHSDHFFGELYVSVVLNLVGSHHRELA